MTQHTAYRRWVPGFLSVALSLLLSVQVVLSFMPQPASAAGGMQVVICGAGGLRTIAIDPATGEELPQSGDSAAKCPFCVVGLAVLGTRIAPLPVDLRHHAAHFALPDTHALPDRQCNTSRIRGPPLTV